MTSGLALAVCVEDLTRDELAEVFNREHASTVSSAQATIMHAIRAGEALLAAKEQTPPGQWTRWLDQVFAASPETANVYMRCAHSQAAILANPDIQSISHARRFLREAGMVRVAHGSQGRGVIVTEALREEARALSCEGLTIAAIANQLGYGISTVHGWLHPESIPARRARLRRSKIQRAETKRAMRDSDRERSIRKVDGPCSEAYSLNRKLGQQLQRAITAAESVDLKNALSIAFDAHIRLNDAIWKAHCEGAR